MATVGPSLARHPSPFRRANRMTRAAPSHSTMQPDPYYGHEDTAKICAHFVTHLFACPDLPPPSTANPPTPSPPLAMFIAYALHRTRLHASVTFAALYLLQRLKARFPAARGSSGHRLFISAFMLASKVICDDTYSNKSWSIVGQGMFALREINQMEREMCSYLEWQLNVDPPQLREFEVKVRRDFKGNGPYPNYVLPSPAPSPMPSTTPYGAPQSHPPSFVSGRAPSTSPPKPITTDPMPSASLRVKTAAPQYSAPMSPDMPDTPESYRSTSTSPASSVSPPTPPGHDDLSAKIVVSEGTLPMSSEPVIPPPSLVSQKAAHYPSHSLSYHHDSAAASLKKSKGDDAFAVAVPCHW